jgi:uncharacterized protein YdhG (YjbR/CyaY superfamily)
MMKTINVEVQKSISDESAKAPDIECVSLELPKARVTAKELIRCFVKEEIKTFKEQRAVSVRRADRILERGYLTEEEIEDQAKRGSIRFPTEKDIEKLPINTTEEVRQATEAFKSRSYTMIVDGIPIEDLDDCLTLKDGSRITFLNLTELMG